MAVFLASFSQANNSKYDNGNDYNYENCSCPKTGFHQVANYRTTTQNKSKRKYNDSGERKFQFHAMIDLLVDFNRNKNWYYNIQYE